MVCNGTAVLGMGNVGPLPALPVIEGKCLLVKLFGDVSAFPMVIDALSVEDVVSFGRMIAPTVGGINIEDISSPETFLIVRELSKHLNIPVFCDDQHGTAVIVLSALKNVLKLTGAGITDTKIVILGAGAAGIATAELLLLAGARNIIVLNKEGILSDSNPAMDVVQSELAAKINPEGIRGGLSEAVAGANVLVGLSRGNIVSGEHIKRMAAKSAVFALALPEPEISKEEAVAAGAYIYTSGIVKDNNNPMLNLHAFPGMVRGAFDVRARKLTDNMLLAAADALSGVIDERRLTSTRILPGFFGQETTPRIAEAVAQAAIKDNAASLNIAPGKVYTDAWNRLYSSIAHI